MLANFEVGEWLKAQGVAEDKVIGMNPGGGIQQPFGHVKFTIAHHSSSMPDGSYGGVPGGWLLKLDDARVYFACDTALFLDMKLIGSGGLDLAVLPIGDRFTMGPDDSLDAIKLLNPKRVAPCHYNTWPPIAQDAAAWAERVRSHTAAEPIVLEPGGKIRLGSWRLEVHNRMRIRHRSKWCACVLWILRRSHWRVVLVGSRGARRPSRCDGSSHVGDKLEFNVTQDMTFEPGRRASRIADRDDRSR